MSASSPYAPFRADEWMRHSLIRPRKAFPVTVSATTKPRARPSGPARVCEAVQGELFLFPVVICWALASATNVCGSRCLIPALSGYPMVFVATPCCCSLPRQLQAVQPSSFLPCWLLGFLLQHPRLLFPRAATTA